MSTQFSSLGQPVDPVPLGAKCEQFVLIDQPVAPVPLVMAALTPGEIPVATLLLRGLPTWKSLLP